MRKLLIIILALALVSLLFSLPFYVLGNFILWAFHASFRLTLIQAFALTLASIAFRLIFFRDRGDK